MQVDDPDNGLSPALLHDTDVLMWWGHKAHDDVADSAVARVHEQVMAGMGGAEGSCIQQMSPLAIEV